MLSRLIRIITGLALVVTMSLADVFTYNVALHTQPSGLERVIPTLVAADVRDDVIRVTHFNNDNDEPTTYAFYRNGTVNGNARYTSPDRTTHVYQLHIDGTPTLYMINNQGASLMYQSH